MRGVLTLHWNGLHQRTTETPISLDTLFRRPTGKLGYDLCEELQKQYSKGCWKWALFTCTPVNSLLCVHPQEWFTVLEHYHRLTATVSDLIMGNSYLFRVFSENQVGRSENSAVTKNAATIQKTGNSLAACSPFIQNVFI